MNTENKDWKNKILRDIWYVMGYISNYGKFLKDGNTRNQQQLETYGTTNWFKNWKGV